MINPHIEIEGDVILVTPSDEHEYTIPTAKVAFGYGVGDSTIREHQRAHSDELREGHHFITVRNSDANPRGGIPHSITLWTKAGVVRLGFFIRSERAKKFRDYAERLIISSLETPKPVPITPAALLLAQAQVLVDLESRTLALESKVKDAPLRGEQRQIIHKLCKTLGALVGYSGAYKRFYERFKVASYIDLGAGQYEEAKKYLEGQISLERGDLST